MYHAPVSRPPHPHPTSIHRPGFAFPPVQSRTYSKNAPKWYRPPQALPPKGRVVDRHHFVVDPSKISNVASPNYFSRMVRPPLMQNLYNHELAPQNRKQGPFQQIQHHPAIQCSKPTVQLVSSKISRPHVDLDLKNETEFPRLDSRNYPELNDINCPSVTSNMSSPPELDQTLSRGSDNPSISKRVESNEKITNRPNKSRKKRKQLRMSDSGGDVLNVQNNCGSATQSVVESIHEDDSVLQSQHLFQDNYSQPRLLPSNGPEQALFNSCNPNSQTLQPTFPNPVYSYPILANPNPPRQYLPQMNMAPQGPKSSRPQLGSSHKLVKMSLNRGNKSRRNEQDYKSGSSGELRSLQKKCGITSQSVDEPLDVQNSSLHDKSQVEGVPLAAVGSRQESSNTNSTTPQSAHPMKPDQIQVPTNAINVEEPSRHDMSQGKGVPLATDISRQDPYYPNSTARQSTHPMRPDPIQVPTPFTYLPYLPQMIVSPQSHLSSPEWASNFCRPNLIAPQSANAKPCNAIIIQNRDLNRRYLSQVSGSPSSSVPQACNPIFLNHPNTIFPVFSPPNHWLHPPNCYPGLTYGRNKTKCDAELEQICYKLHSPTGLKPVDEVSLAKESDFELYQIMKFKEEEVAESIAEFYTGQPREDFVEAFAKIFKWMETVKSKDKLHKEVEEKTMTLYPEYAKKMEILKTMNYVVEDSVQMKGYMAARISKYELVITEMLVRNVIKDLTPEEVAGLMSFIVYQAKTVPAQNDDSEPEVPIAHGLPNLQKAIENTKTIILEIMYEENSRDVVSEELDNLIDSFKLTDIMYQWAKQKSFSKVISMAKDFQEGMLVRWIQQLVEALKEIESSARVMGDPAVPEKIQASIKSIKRGIVFSPSLYTTL
ncbi:hypothetical protein GE061_008339 [Apolygus lucorum]|uniref:ATP-dependent RNA helicase Ski2/MTR4 C-terminal domain-containing protein n=1 Tax=Apolygus lucorum TaxID=248454 RepID=A0A8S9WR15_APOLU|nr:hypothetical protein GE061_008339 [Apolygus lucorum]